MKRPRGTGSIFRRPNSPHWWLAYYRRGKLYRESTRTDNRRKAEKMLSERLAQIHTGSFLGLTTERIKVEELADDLLRDYRINGKASLEDVEARWNLHLKPFFGHLRACEVTSTLVAQYVDSRLHAGVANSTLNRELACLKRAFNLGLRCTPPKVRVVPHIPRLREDNVRTGFVESAAYQRLADATAQAGIWLRGLFEMGYTLGWRVGELLNLRVKQVDLSAAVVRLNPGETKNGRGRVAALTPALLALLEECIHGKRPDDAVFTRAGNRPVKNFRGAWATACREAGVPDLLFHDLRRTAVRNMVRAGVPEHQAMMISGHLTRSIFDRYDVVNEQDLAAAMTKVEAFHRREHAHFIHTEQAGQAAEAQDNPSN